MGKSKTDNKEPISMVVLRGLNDKHREAIELLKERHETHTASSAILQALIEDFKKDSQVQNLKRELTLAKNKIMAYQAFWELRNQMRLIETEFALDKTDID